jgi:hypothetical protein
MNVLGNSTFASVTVLDSFMPTSELSDALNPNVIQSRRYENTNYSPPQPYEQVATYGSSELGLAVVEPQRLSLITLLLIQPLI